VEVRRIDVGGVGTPVTEVGDPGAEEAVVLVHGNPGSARDWEDLLGRIGPFARAVAPDMPGFGAADKPDAFPYTVRGYAEHLDGLLAALGIRRAHLVLHDFGGPWGLAWAASHPQALASVTLVNTGVLIGYRWHYLARLWRTPGVGEAFMATATLPAFRLLLRHGNPRGLPPAAVERMFREFDRDTRRAVLRLYRATPAGMAEAPLPALRERDAPALVLWGRHDPYIPLVQAERQRQAFPHAEVVVLDGSGHWPMLDDPDGVAAAVLPFLARQLGAA
jgi:pimeloyl-ACP methyl ester carboxylesterase